MKGVARKSSKQLPGLESDCPPPSAPAAVCCYSSNRLAKKNEEQTEISKLTHHSKAVANP